jgi:threonine dehydrogenase-like Zn-dependent dehydrogenase
MEVQTVQIPDLKAGAMLARVEAATLCGTDVHRWQGAQDLVPFIPGHETAMTIADMSGPRWDNLGEALQPGDRILSAYPSCGHCYYCSVALQTNLCRERISYGHQHPSELLGGCAEYHYIPPGGDIVRIPDDVSSPLAASAACALRTVLHGFDRLGPVLPHETVVVQGSGPLGMYAIAVARDHGANKVLVIGAPEGRLQAALQFGADGVLNIEEHPDPAVRKEWVLEHTSGRGPDIVIQVAGSSAAIPEGLDFIRPGGRYVSIGGGGGNQSVPVRLLGKYLTFVSIANTLGRHFHHALQFLASKQKLYPFHLILSTTYPLEQATDAIQAMADYRIVKPVILPWGE